MKTTFTTLALCLGFSGMLLAQSQPENVQPAATNSEKAKLSTSTDIKAEPKLSESEKIVPQASDKSRKKGKPELKEVGKKSEDED